MLYAAVWQNKYWHIKQINVKNCSLYTIYTPNVSVLPNNSTCLWCSRSV